MKKYTLGFLTAVLGLTLGIGQAYATNITIQDFAGGGGFGGGPFLSGSGLEDNETEPGTIQSQVWDMEAFVIDTSSFNAAHKSLFVVGGYDLINGEYSGAQNRNLTSGDVFIKVGGSQPGFAPTTSTPSAVPNSYYDYTYAVDLSAIGLAVGTGSTTAYSLSSTSTLNTVIYDQFGANPWTYRSGATSSVAANIKYTAGLANGHAALAALGLGGLVGGSHNILEIELAFLTDTVPDGTDVWFSYTMECGNDSLKGNYSGGFDRVPDGGITALLIGLGLLSMSAVGLRRRKA